MKNEKVLNTIEEAIEDFRQGKIVIVVDDEDRENEGDFIIAAEKVTPEIVNFMLKNGRGVLCAPLSRRALRTARTQHDGAEQHLAARHAVHRDGRSAGRRLHHGRFDPRPCGDPAGTGRPEYQTLRPGACRDTSTRSGPSERRSAPSGTYRSRRGPGSTGRAASPPEH